MAVQLDQPLPDWELSSLQQPSRPYRFSDYRGKVVVVLFWAANPLCKRYVRYLEGFSATYRARGAVFLVVDPEPLDTATRIRRICGGKLPRFPILRDAEGKVARAFGVAVTPTVYVADHEGILRYWGAIDDRSFEKPWPDTNYLEEAVERLLIGEEVADPHNPPVGHNLTLDSTLTLAR